MGNGVNESQFYMWRTLFALAHADHIVTEEEVRFMAEAMEDVSFSDAQKAILTKDTTDAQNIELMFASITDVKDQAAFFKYAHELVHIDGEYGMEEQAVMLKLKEVHTKMANLDDLIGSVSLELEDDYTPMDNHQPQDNFEKTIFSFRSWFGKKD